MKKAIALLLAAIMLLSTAACSTGKPQHTGTESGKTSPEEAPPIITFDVEIKTSPDKYTWYVKNYVGKNAASVGYTSIGGDRMDTYGSGYIKLILLTPKGEYVDIHSEDELKNWRVIGQSLAPNTELKMVYSVDSNGNEYDNLVASQNIEEIELIVTKVNSYTEAPEETVPET